MSFFNLNHYLLDPKRVSQALFILYYPLLNGTNKMEMKMKWKKKIVHLASFLKWDFLGLGRWTVSRERERAGTECIDGQAPRHFIHSLFSMAEGGIFAEDIVKNAQGNVGVVLEDAEETTDESDSDEEALKKGQIVVCWYPAGNEETISISKVAVLYLHLRNVYRHFDFDPRNLNCLIFFFILTSVSFLLRLKFISFTLLYQLNVSIFPSPDWKKKQH